MWGAGATNSKRKKRRILSFCVEQTEMRLTGQNEWKWKINWIFKIPSVLIIGQSVSDTGKENGFKILSVTFILPLCPFKISTFGGGKFRIAADRHTSSWSVQNSRILALLEHIYFGFNYGLIRKIINFLMMSPKSRLQGSQNNPSWCGGIKKGLIEEGDFQTDKKQSTNTSSTLLGLFLHSTQGSNLKHVFQTCHPLALWQTEQQSVLLLLFFTPLSLF